MREAVRKESEIFSELAEICGSPGYVHAIAFLCYQNDIVRYADTLTPEDMLQQFSKDSLVRTEISTLIGLACNNSPDSFLEATAECGFQASNLR